MFHRAFGLLSGYTRGSRWRNAGCGVLSDGLCPASLSNEGEFCNRSILRSPLDHALNALHGHMRANFKLELEAMVDGCDHC
jgi:hypothetical protein|eukprot:COSAG03_NODE_42_length_17101_cov_8.739031_8_plen_81_part_00